MKARGHAALAASLVLAVSCSRASVNSAIATSGSPGSLVLGGGEYIHPAVRQRFVELAGGRAKNFVYVPTASSGIRLESGFEYEPADSDAPNPRDSLFAAELARLFDVDRISILHTRSRTTANSDAFNERIRRADGVWLSGGNAGRLASAFLGTRVERELQALLARGGVVGGNSAGAIIQGSLIIRGRPDKPVLMAPGHTQGFGFLPNVAINPHLLSQKRENELITVLDAHAELLGIGIPDSAGIVVRGGIFDVLGNGRVAVYDNVKHGCCWYYWVKPGERFDLAQRRLAPR